MGLLAIGAEDHCSSYEVNEWEKGSYEVNKITQKELFD